MPANQASSSPGPCSPVAAWPGLRRAGLSVRRGGAVSKPSLDGWSENAVRPGAFLTKHDAAIIASSYPEGTGEQRAWCQATCQGRHPAVPRFPVNFRSIIYLDAEEGRDLLPDRQADDRGDEEERQQEEQEADAGPVALALVLQAARPRAPVAAAVRGRARADTRADREAPRRLWARRRAPDGAQARPWDAILAAPSRFRKHESAFPGAVPGVHNELVKGSSEALSVSSSQAQRDEDALEALAGAALELLRAKPLDQVLAALVRAAARASGAQVVLARVLDGPAEALVTRAVHADSPALTAELAGTRVAAAELGSEELEFVAAPGNPEAPAAIRRAASRAGASHALVVPVPGEDGVVGSLDLLRSGVPLLAARARVGTRCRRSSRHRGPGGAGRRR